MAEKSWGHRHVKMITTVLRDKWPALEVGETYCAFDDAVEYIVRNRFGTEVFNPHCDADSFIADLKVAQEAQEPQDAQEPQEAQEPFVTELCALIDKHRHTFGEVRKVVIYSPILVEVQLKPTERESFLNLAEKYKGAPGPGPIPLMVEWKPEDME